jgi:16S rRNA C967 or C1407 C5-methylase (RsmB/RsmF family)/NOL1/NOP2/fmu family ribosome biogenesis protein
LTVLPQSLLHSLQGVPGFDEEAFKEVHTSGEQVTSVRINAVKASIDKLQTSIENSIHHSAFIIHNKVSWCATGYYLEQRPSFTFDPLFHAGCYYVQEASSMFLEQALSQTVDLSQPLKVLDLCAAPGGKSTHVQSLLSKESLLVSNEVIRSRTNILIDNMVKWGSKNVVVTNNDPVHFQKLPDFFDIIIVDAPCSGSGLFRRDKDAMEEWSLQAVALCSQRQQRILADVLPALKENGILIYSTCSYSKEEDEEIGEWLVKEMGLENEELKVEKAWSIVKTSSEKTGANGYRFFPDKVKGEGFFLSCFRKKTSNTIHKYKAKKLEKIPAKEKSIIEAWITDKEAEMIKLYNGLYIIPQHLYGDITMVSAVLNVQYAGVQAGEIMKEKLVPAHALALSSLLNHSVATVEVDYQTAIKYLQKGDATIETHTKGWQVISYKGHTIGWINALTNRINNYYPKELRILKQHNDLTIKK